ncbi:MAG: histidine phosphatase family protein [Ilumatobacteraceae bacterium]
MTRLVLVRHGESRATVERFLGGPRTCTGLTNFGRAQATALRDRLVSGHDVAATALYASNFPRAIETANIVAPAIGSLPLTVDAGWGEHDPGPDCDGMPYLEFVERFGTPKWDDLHANVFPGGETVAQFQERVIETLRRTVRNNEGGTVLVSCHGGVIDTVLRHTLQMHPVGKFELSTTNTSLTELQHIQGSKWKLIRYNDAAHLSGLVRPESQGS